MRSSRIEKYPWSERLLTVCPPLLATTRRRFAGAEDDEAVALHNRTAVNLRLGGPLDGRLHGRFARRGAALVRAAAFLGLARGRAALLGTAGGRAALFGLARSRAAFLGAARGRTALLGLRGRAACRCAFRRLACRRAACRRRLGGRIGRVAAFLRRARFRRIALPAAFRRRFGRVRGAALLTSALSGAEDVSPSFAAQASSPTPSAGGRTGTNKEFFSYASTSFSAEKPF